MKPRLYSYAAIVLASAVLVFSCKKGDTGPAGPAGPAGANGAAGAPGPKGDSATANVTYSAWTDVAFSPVTVPDTVNPAKKDTLYFVGAIVAPKLTADVISKGQISTYLNFGTVGSPDVVPLPFADLIFTGWNIQVDYAVDSIYLTANVNASTYGSGAAKQAQYRYVIIPGTKPASVNSKDYSSVKSYF
ncbi:hypothetical protein ACQ86N_39435 [Puia sp. P3]|uniref:hypothetical protein n=1 Tax=Puia sp. P3 TaxID=3423952 RepID=UPI003D669224